MRAIVCEKLGTPGDLVLRELPDPPEPGAGEIKVALTARGVQFVDVLMVAGEYQTKPPLPFIPGGEAAGEVIAAGPDVTAFKVGDKVCLQEDDESKGVMLISPESYGENVVVTYCTSAKYSGQEGAFVKRRFMVLA